MPYPLLLNCLPQLLGIFSLLLYSFPFVENEALQVLQSLCLGYVWVSPVSELFKEKGPCFFH